MRKARQVEVEEPVSADDHKDLLKHAKNSAEYYCGAGMKTASMVEEKLRAKGYPRGDVELYDGSTVNYIDEAIEYCSSLYILYSEEDYCNEIISSGIRAGKGPLELRQKFMTKRISPEVVQEFLDDYPAYEAMENGLRKALRSSRVRKADGNRERKQRLTEYFATKGFGFGDIREALESLEWEDDEQD